MRKGNIFWILLVIAGGIISLIGNTGCANMVPPTGGPRDSLPPVLMSVLPLDSTKNFNSKKVVFEFDEYVQLDNVQSNLLVNPTPKIPPTVQSKLRTVTVTIKDTLDENTTYSINFGNAIKDINEGNPLRNFRYIFSTGSYIDSLTLSGKVIVAETGKTDSTIVAILHRSADDSAVVNERPDYVTRLDSNGRFMFRNLPAGTFYLYALKDEGGTRRYLSPQQLFAFADSSFTTTNNNAPVTLYAYAEKDTTTQKKPGGAKPSKGKPNNNQPENMLRLQSNITGGQLDLLSQVEFAFAQAPFKYFDSSKVQLTTDSLQPLTGYYFTTDTSNTRVTLHYNWQENTPYKILLDQDFAEDTSGRKLLKSDTLAFRTKKESEYGEVKLRFLNLDLSRNPVLQFVQTDQVKYTHVFTDNQFNDRLFLPGEYDLRIVYDENKNGIWDPGSFFGEKKQPEKVLLISRKLNVKANWTNQVDVTL